MYITITVSKYPADTTKQLCVKPSRNQKVKKSYPSQVFIFQRICNKGNIDYYTSCKFLQSQQCTQYEGIESFERFIQAQYGNQRLYYCQQHTITETLESFGCFIQAQYDNQRLHYCQQHTITKMLESFGCFIQAQYGNQKLHYCQQHIITKTFESFGCLILSAFTNSTITCWNTEIQFSYFIL